LFEIELKKFVFLVSAKSADRLFQKNLTGKQMNGKNFSDIQMMAGRIGGESRGFITGKNVSYTLMAE
jgi:hypothetical protein